MPVRLIGIFIAILVFATIYAKGYQGGRDAVGGAAGAFVGVNSGTIQISGKLALELAASALIEWTMVGVVVGLLHKA
jgi:hypothetical protein